MENNVVTKPTVFISYSHKDEAWKDRIVIHLGALAQEGILDTWDDRHICAGADWKKEIEDALKKASAAVLLVSADFLNSKFILDEEVPKLLERREKEGLRIFPVVIRPCAWKRIKWLSRMNLHPRDGKPLIGGTEFQIETDTWQRSPRRLQISLDMQQKYPKKADICHYLLRKSLSPNSLPQIPNYSVVKKN
ncbi:hypothetical protein METP2_00333 [Methanosarcinales archaeon]|nr:toll/interleukin-1 receptor domain-containing protein [Candidatus Methanoperedens sp.]CAG0953105.1 hypothetical protein METP2_00333 [Methanosarcinales archaeon]